MSLQARTRTPKDDATPFDPTVWANDCFFLSQLERNPSLLHARLGPSSGSTAVKGPMSEHLQPPQDASWKTFLRTQLKQLWTKIRSRTSERDFSKHSVAELQTMLDALCRTGDQNGAAHCAKELAKRSVPLHLRPPPPPRPEADALRGWVERKPDGW